MRSIPLFAAVLLFALIASPPSTDGARILALFAFPGKSQSHMLNAVLRGLLARGHHITAMSNYPLPASTPNYTHIDISPAFDIWLLSRREFGVLNAFDLHSVPPEHENVFMYNMSLATTEHALRHRNVQRLLHSDQHFDLVLVEQFLQDAFLMCGHQFGAPVVSIATYEYEQHHNDMLGVYGAWSHVPHERLLARHPLSFWQRLQNVKLSLLNYVGRHWFYMPSQQALADKYFAHLPAPRPSLEQLNRNISLLLVNGHAPQSAVRPVVPGLIDVGGLHIEPAKPLPADLQAFLDGAGEQGVIYFSFGTHLRSSEMRADKVAAFVAAFERLPGVRVLWKFEDESLAARLSANVMIRSWLPQNDILAHPKVRVFITHGGLLGHQEAIYHGVPMLGIPVFADQHQNIAKAEMAGYAVGLRFGNITESSLDWALRELLFEARYLREMRRVSAIFRDRSERPLDRALWWIEYVIRHRGAGHLRSGALDMSWISYMLLDVWAFVLAVGVAVILVGVKLIQYFLKFVIRKEESISEKQKQKRF